MHLVRGCGQQASAGKINGQMRSPHQAPISRGEAVSTPEPTTTDLQARVLENVDDLICSLIQSELRSGLNSEYLDRLVDT